jgi:hypothetical protein
MVQVGGVKRGRTGLRLSAAERHGQGEVSEKSMDYYGGSGDEGVAKEDNGGAPTL